MPWQKRFVSFVSDPPGIPRLDRVQTTAGPWAFDAAGDKDTASEAIRFGRCASAGQILIVFGEFI
jgi:hypothetical protein